MTSAEQGGKPAISPKRRRVYIAVMLSCWLVVLGIIGLKIFEYSRDHGLKRTYAPRARRPVHPGLKGGTTHPLFDDDAFVLDDLTYVRPRPEYVARRTSNSIRGDRESVFHVTHVERGIIRHEAVGSKPGKPTVLLLGDSHIYSTVSMEEHVYYLLEQRLRQEPGCAEATVINGGCPYYSLYQYVLRARALWDYVDPDVVVVISFMGNDLLELEDVSRPHIDDQLEERGISDSIPRQTTDERAKLFHRTATKSYRRMFWQGINQEIYFLQKRDRYEVVLRKAGRAIELLSKLCEENGAKLIIALLPPFEDTYDYRLPFELDPSIADLVERKTNRAFRVDLMRLIEGQEIIAVDFFDGLHASHAKDLYDADFHIWTAGHALLADALLPVVRSQLCNGR